VFKVNTFNPHSQTIVFNLCGNPPGFSGGLPKQKAKLKKERGLALSRKDEHLRTLGRFGDYEPSF
jgi:hypothetical protein